MLHATDQRHADPSHVTILFCAGSNSFLQNIVRRRKKPRMEPLAIPLQGEAAATLCEPSCVISTQEILSVSCCDWIRKSNWIPVAWSDWDLATVLPNPETPFTMSTHEFARTTTGVSVCGVPWRVTISTQTPFFCGWKSPRGVSRHSSHCRTASVYAV
jgi:hypothetical protein